MSARRLPGWWLKMKSCASAAVGRVPVTSSQTRRANTASEQGFAGVRFSARRRASTSSSNCWSCFSSLSVRPFWNPGAGPAVTGYSNGVAAGNRSVSSSSPRRGNQIPAGEGVVTDLGRALGYRTKKDASPCGKRIRPPSPLPSPPGEGESSPVAQSSDGSSGRRVNGSRQGERLRPGCGGRPATSGTGGRPDGGNRVGRHIFSPC